MKKLTLKDVEHYTKLELIGIKSDIVTINRLITILFLENIAIILLLIIWSW